MKSLDKYLTESLIKEGYDTDLFLKWYDLKNPKDIVAALEMWFEMNAELSYEGWIDFGDEDNYDEENGSIGEQVDELGIDFPFTDSDRLKDWNVSNKGNTIEVFMQSQEARPEDIFRMFKQVIKDAKFNKQCSFEVEVWDRSGHQKEYKI